MSIADILFDFPSIIIKKILSKFLKKIPLTPCLPAGRPLFQRGKIKNNKKTATITHLRIVALFRRNQLFIFLFRVFMLSV